MKARTLAGVLCILVFSLLLFPVETSFVSKSDLQSDNTQNPYSNAAAEPPYKMKLNLIEDGSVISNWSDLNFDGNTYKGGLWVGFEATDGWTRSWLKFDTSRLLDGFTIFSAKLNIYCNDEYNSTADEPIGVYYSTNDTWSEDGITWDDQPSFDSTPLDEIDTPVGPDLIVNKTWYQLDITNVVKSTYNGDDVLSLVLKQVDEVGTDDTWKYFAGKEYDFLNSCFITVEYYHPIILDINVDGYTFNPYLENIQSSTPTLAWNFAGGADSNQQDYEFEINDGANVVYNDTMGDIYTLFHQTGFLNARPFATQDEMRFQVKYESSMFERGGLIDKLYIEASSSGFDATLENLQINLIEHPTETDLTADFDANYGTAPVVTVLNSEEYHVLYESDWLIFDVEDTFVHNCRNSLIIEFRFTNNSGDLAHCFITNDNLSSVAYTYGPGAYYSTTADHLFNRTYNVKIEYASDPVIEFLGGGSTNNYPFRVDSGTSGRYQQMYNGSMINRTGLIDRLYFDVAMTGYCTYSDFELRLVETPHEGVLNATSMNQNYGGVTPTLVVDAAEYTVKNIGGVAVIVFDTPFLYTGEHNLLIDFQWNSRTGPGIVTYLQFQSGGYRAYDVTWLSSHIIGESKHGMSLHLGFTRTAQQAVCGINLTEDVEYHWRIRVCDGTGIWTPWTTQYFTHHIITDGPDHTDLQITPNPVFATQNTTISINVTHLFGVNTVLFEVDGTNHTMTGVGDIYTYIWNPAVIGDYSYRIFMESTIGTWSVLVSGSDIFVSGSNPTWVNLVFDPVTAESGDEVEISIDVTDTVGVEMVLLEIEGSNHTMTASGDTYSFTWTPSSASNYDYVIYMKSVTGLWNSTSGTYVVQNTTTTTTPTPPLDVNLILIIGGAIAAVVIVVIILQKRKK